MRECQSGRMDSTANAAAKARVGSNPASRSFEEEIRQRDEDIARRNYERQLEGFAGLLFFFLLPLALALVGALFDYLGV